MGVSGQSGLLKACFSQSGCGVMGHACDANTREAEVGDGRFQASLGYKVSSCVSKITRPFPPRYKVKQ